MGDHEGNMLLSFSSRGEGGGENCLFRAVTVSIEKNISSCFLLAQSLNILISLPFYVFASLLQVKLDIYLILTTICSYTIEASLGV